MSRLVLGNLSHHLLCATHELEQMCSPAPLTQTVHGRCRAVADRDPPPDDDRGVDIDALARMLSREANRMRDSYVRTTPCVTLAIHAYMQYRHHMTKNIGTIRAPFAQHADPSERLSANCAGW